MLCHALQSGVPDERPITKFLANDLALSKALATSYFGTIGVKGVQKNMVPQQLEFTKAKIK